MNRSIIKDKLHQWFRIDLRSLAVVRIGVGLIILADLLIRAQDLTAFYTDGGVLPRGALIDKFERSQWSLSVHLLSGAPGFQALLFLMAGVFALGMVFGYRTRLCTAVSWVLLISLHTRNPMVLHGGDVFLRVLLFWMMFLPLGRRWSLDSLRTPVGSAASHNVCSVGGVCLMLQICFVYWFSSLLKTGISWHDGTALYYALNYDQLATPLGSWLLLNPGLLKFVTHATYALEWFGPWLLFFPVLTIPLRYGVLAAFLLFHLSLVFTLELSLFPFVCMVAWLVFLPSSFWERAIPTLALALSAIGVPVTKVVDQIHSWARRLSLALPVVPENANPIGGMTWASRAGQNFLVCAFLPFCLVYVFAWNLRTTDSKRYTKLLPREYNDFGYLFRLDQYWNMFAPNPSREDGWYVIPGKLMDGTEVDLFTGGLPVTWEKPKVVSATYQNQRWRKYMMNLASKSNSEHRLHYARNLCRVWNAKHHYGARLDSFQIYFMLETTPLPGELPTVRKILLWNHYCFGKPANKAPAKAVPKTGGGTTVPAPKSRPDSTQTNALRGPPPAKRTIQEPAAAN